MADDSTQRIITQISTILNRMDDEKRANTLEQIAKHVKELNNDRKIEEDSNKVHKRKITNNHNSSKRVLPEAFMNSVLTGLMKDSCEVSAQSRSKESAWISLRIKKSAITPELCSSSSSIQPQIQKPIDIPDISRATDQLLTILLQIDKEKQARILKQVSKHTKEFSKSIEKEKANFNERIQKLSASHNPRKKTLPEPLMSAEMKDVSSQIFVQRSPFGGKVITLKIKKSSLAQT